MKWGKGRPLKRWECKAFDTNPDAVHDKCPQGLNYALGARIYTLQGGAPTLCFPLNHHSVERNMDFESAKGTVISRKVPVCARHEKPASASTFGSKDYVKKVIMKNHLEAIKEQGKEA